MIYAIPSDNYPKEGQFIEEHSYKDENDFEWRIARINNGFMIRYFGDPYFSEKYFSIDANGKHYLVNNTNCIFFRDSSFETFCDLRDILKEGYTDEIWESFAEFFEERFIHNEGFLESEIVKYGE